MLNSPFCALSHLSAPGLALAAAKPLVPSISHLENLQRTIMSSHDEADRIEAIAEVIHIGFDDNNSPEVLNAAFSMLINGVQFNPGLLNTFQIWNAQLSSRILKPLAAMMDSDHSQLEKVAGAALADLRSTIASREHYLLSEPIMKAAYSLYAVADLGGPDRRSEIDQILLDHYSPLTIFPASLALTVSGMLTMWDRFEHLIAFDYLFSANVNRKNYMHNKIIGLAAIEEESGSEATGLRMLAKALDSEQELNALKPFVIPERCITTTGITKMIETVCGAAALMMGPDMGSSFLAHLTTTVGHQVETMPLLELSHLFMLEGGAAMPHGAPLKVIIEAALNSIDQLVADESMGIDMAAQIIDRLKLVVSILAKALEEERLVPEGYLDFDNPYAVTSPRGQS